MQDPLGFLGESLLTQNAREETLKNIKLIIRIRFFITPTIFIIMFIAGIFGFTRESAFSENQIIVNAVNLVFMLIMNVIYLVLVRRIDNLKRLVMFQVIVDIVLYSLTVYKTGGGTSPFTFLYLMVIFSSAMMVTGRTAYLTAGITSLAFFRNHSPGADQRDPPSGFFQPPFRLAGKHILSRADLGIHGLLVFRLCRSSGVSHRPAAE